MSVYSSAYVVSPCWYVETYTRTHIHVHAYLSSFSIVSHVLFHLVPLVVPLVSVPRSCSSCSWFTSSCLSFPPSSVHYLFPHIPFPRDILTVLPPHHTGLPPFLLPSTSALDHLYYTLPPHLFNLPPLLSSASSFSSTFCVPYTPCTFSYDVRTNGGDFDCLYTTTLKSYKEEALKFLLLLLPLR